MILLLLQAELAELERYFRYCSGLRERRPLPQRHYFKTALGLAGGWVGGWKGGGQAVRGGLCANTARFSGRVAALT